MKAEQLYSVLRDAGYNAALITAIQEGSNHDVFDVTLAGGKHAICKFAKLRETERAHGEAGSDTLFGGRLSLEREAYLLALARREGCLPVPVLYGLHNSVFGRYIMMEKSPGISFTEWQQAQGYRKQPFLDSLEALGRDFAKLHRTIHFDSFGDIQTDGVIEPGCKNFADRFEEVVRRRIARGVSKGTFSVAEAEVLSKFFRARFDSLRPVLSASVCRAVMVFTDMHGRNFFVDQSGVPSGYFDLESSQAAPAALEFYGFRFFLFNFFDEETFPLAEQAFFRGYAAEGGPCAPQTAEDYALIELLSACRLLELAESYWGVADAIRSTWGVRMKALLSQYMACGNVDYAALGAMWRERDGQPLHPVEHGENET